MDTPATAAASPLLSPCAIACQNGRRAARCKTGGRPGNRSFARRARLDFLFFSSIITSVQKVLRRRVELTQYKMPPYQAMLARHGVTQSMSRKGNCLDNAVIASFFGTLKAEYFRLEAIDSVEALEAGVNDYIRYYNDKRIKLSLQGLSPVEYRMKMAA